MHIELSILPKGPNPERATPGIYAHTLPTPACAALSLPDTANTPAHFVPACHCNRMRDMICPLHPTSI